MTTRCHTQNYTTLTDTTLEIIEAAVLDPRSERSEQGRRFGHGHSHRHMSARWNRGDGSFRADDFSSVVGKHAA
jgi:hypothetical protein